MIVVADTSPLNYLILIGHIDILEALYQEVVIPPAVQDEMLDVLAPATVRAWITNPPRWLEVRTPGRVDLPLARSLDDGEREAIILAKSMSSETLLLIDERQGRQEALRLGLEIIGTLGVLQLAHERGMLSMRDAIERLRKTTFKASEALLRQFIDRR